MGCRRPSPAPLLLLLLLLSGHASAAMNVQALQKQVKRHMKRAHSLMDKDFDVRAAFDMHDYNSDGYIDRDEAFTLYENDPISDEQIEQELDGTFGVMDVDKDGKMSYKEFSRFFERAIRNKPLHPELTGG